MKVTVTTELTTYQQHEVEIPDGTPTDKVYDAVIASDKWTPIGVPDVDVMSGEWIEISETKDGNTHAIWSRE